MKVQSRSASAGVLPDGTAKARRGKAAPPAGPVPSRWTFLTNHAHVLVLLARHPSIVLREVAVQVGITERAVQRITQELEQEGYIVRQRVGRQNCYQVNGELSLRHPVAGHCRIQELLGLVSRRIDART